MDSEAASPSLGGVTGWWKTGYFVCETVKFRFLATVNQCV
jgi:hypothetical protein